MKQHSVRRRSEHPRPYLALLANHNLIGNVFAVGGIPVHAEGVCSVHLHPGRHGRGVNHVVLRAVTHGVVVVKEAGILERKT